MTDTEFLQGMEASPGLLPLLRLASAALGGPLAPPTTPTEATAEAEVSEAFQQVLPEERTSGLLTREQRRSLVRTAEQAVRRPGGRPMAARALLHAIDQRMQSQVGMAFEAAGGELRLGTGDVFPIASHNLKTFFGGRSCTPAPRSTSRPEERFNYLGLLPPLAPGYEVVFDFRTGPALAPFVANPVAAVLLPNQDAAKELQFERNPARATFFHVRPKDLPRQRQRIVPLLEQAAVSQLPVVVLPELSVTADLSREVGEEARARRIPLTVAGSFHAPEDKASDAWGFNCAETYTLLHSSPLPHHKVSPYVLRAWGTEDIKPPLQEDIQAQPRVLRVCWSSGWSFVTLICKDLMDEEILHLLRRLRPNFLFVAALSSDTTLFEATVVQLATSAQTMSVIANFPGTATSTAKAAIAAFPLAARQLASIAWQDKGEAALLAFDFRSASLAWHPRGGA